MSQFSVPIIKLRGFGKHPNADTLSITDIEGCPVVFKTGSIAKGDLAVYIPVEAVIDGNLPWTRKALSFLKYKNDMTYRVKAMRLRGVFSMGILLPFKEIEDFIAGEVKEGRDLSYDLSIVKYEEPEDLLMTGNRVKDPGVAPIYDMESYRKYHKIFEDVGNIAITEKIHGSNCRIVYHNDTVMVGSHRVWLGEDDNNMFWHTIKLNEIDKKIKNYPDLVVYGEVFGNQDLKYDTKAGEYKFRAFDIYDSKKGLYLDWADFKSFCKELDIVTAPILYEGPYSDAIVRELVSGKSLLASHFREGIVIRSQKEIYNPKTRRTVLKLVSEEYLTRKDGTEGH